MGQAALIPLLSVGATAYSIDQQQKAGRAQERAERIRQKQADAQNRRQRIQQLRQARIARANAIAAQSGTSGGMASSQALGTTASIQSQLGSNLGFMNQQQGFNQAIGQQNIRASQAMTNAGTAQAIGGVASGVFEAQGGYEELFKA